MTDAFKPGEIGVLIGGFVGEYPYEAGDEVEIISGPTEPRDPKATPGVVYYLVLYQGVEVYARREMLRKRKPPSREIDRVTSWDKCDWRPCVLSTSEDA